MTIDEISAADLKAIAEAVPVAPVGLRVEMSPYPHLRDDNGCVLARDWIDFGKVAFILAAVSEKVEVSQ